MTESDEIERIMKEFNPDDDYQCPRCGGVLDYTASSEDYHRYECGCGTKLLVPKKEAQ